MSNDETPLNRTSLYEQVAIRLLKQIQANNKPGDRLPSEVVLSKQLGVSAITLREALSVLSYRGCIERRHGSGTYVADPHASQWIAIVTNLDLSHPYLSYFHRRLAYRLRFLLSDAGLRVRIYSGTASGKPSLTDEADLPEAPLADLKLGLIRAVVFLPSSGWEVFRDAGVALVGTNPALPFSASLRHEEMLPSALKSLAQRGCKSVALLCWEGTGLAIDQWEKYLTEHGLSTHPEWIKDQLPFNGSAPGWNAFHELWNSRPEKPDGVIVDDDILFREVSLAILAERISVPDELKVFTSYNTGSRVILPFPCVTYEVDPDVFAQELALLCQLAIGDSPQKAKHTGVPVQIVEHNPPSSVIKNS